MLDWNGWNFLDYRTAKKLPATEITTSDRGWPNFVQPGAQLAVATNDQDWGTWKVIGIQDQYDALKNMIEELQLAQSSGRASAARENVAEAGQQLPDIGPTS